MNSRRLAKAIGWALAYFVGGGLLFLVCVALLIAWTGLPEPPELLWNILLGTSLLFSCVAVCHEFTGKLPRTNNVLRTVVLFVLWPLLFYFATLLIVMLALSIPKIGSTFGILIFAPALAGGAAGSLCWRGRLPGTHAIGSFRPPQAPDKEDGPRKEEGEEEDRKAR